ncbi:hypothetical protein AB5I39_13420 [Sphingomonas sp. MMS24-J45]|uniref:hypothetical protein n=1 Tax=Sphingomonas sp. MMS24-J45 TaxID=3238806 RepID=UPI00384B8FB1
MKTALLIPVLLVAGLGVGGGAAFGVRQLLPPPAATQEAAHPKVETAFVPTGKILAPLVSADGRLAGYVQFEVQLETDEHEVDFVTTRLPLLMDAINMRTYRTPMTSGPGGMLPDLAVFRKVVMTSAAEAYGGKIVKRAVIMTATPA